MSSAASGSLSLRRLFGCLVFSLISSEVIRGCVVAGAVGVGVHVPNSEVERWQFFQVE